MHPAPRQPSLLDRGTLEERFEAFCEAHPHVEREIVALARRARAKGLGKWSVKAAFEYIRWKHWFDSGEEWTLNNSYTSLMARRIMDRHPDLDGFFETRARRVA